MENAFCACNCVCKKSRSVNGTTVWLEGKRYAAVKTESPFAAWRIKTEVGIFAEVPKDDFDEYFSEG